MSKKSREEYNNIAKYKVVVGATLVALNQAIGDFGETNPLRGTDSNLLTSEQANEWKITAAVCIEKINAECDKLLYYDVAPIPIKYHVAHKEIIAAAKDYKEMVACFAKGVTDFDSQELDEMMKYMRLGSEHIQEANYLFQLTV